MKRVAHNRIDLTGKKFNKLTVIEYACTEKKAAVWKCLCECGNYKLVRTGNLLNGHTKSCGCFKKKLPFGQAAKHGLYWKYKSHANTRNKNFRLARKTFLAMTSQNCYYCGVEPKQVFIDKRSNGFYRYNGLDRVNNLKGYSKLNCVPCCALCNTWKGALSQKEFLIRVNKINTNCNKETM